MNERDTELAEQAGFDAHHAEFDTRIKAFADLIRADEREACAKLCDKQAEGAYWEGADACAELIRAKGNT